MKQRLILFFSWWNLNWNDGVSRCVCFVCVCFWERARESRTDIIWLFISTHLFVLCKHDVHLFGSQSAAFTYIVCLCACVFLWLHMHASNNNGTPLYKKWYIKPWEPVVRGRNAGKNIPLNPLLLLRDPEGENGGRHWTRMDTVSVDGYDEDEPLLCECRRRKNKQH